MAGEFGRLLGRMGRNLTRSAAEGAPHYMSNMGAMAGIMGTVGGIREKADGGSFWGGAVRGAVGGATIGAGWTAFKFAGLGRRAIMPSGKLASFDKTIGGYSRAWAGKRPIRLNKPKPSKKWTKADFAKDTSTARNVTSS